MTQEQRDEFWAEVDLLQVKYATFCNRAYPPLRISEYVDVTLIAGMGVQLHFLKDYPFPKDLKEDIRKGFVKVFS